MDPYDRVSLADAVVEHKFNKGEYIIRQGDEGDRFYFIISGEAIVTFKNNLFYSETLLYSNSVN